MSIMRHTRPCSELWMLVLLLVHTNHVVLGLRPPDLSWRRLKQLVDTCGIDNCESSSCLWRKNGWKCTACAAGYQLSSQGSKCVCQAGKKAVSSGCTPCPQGWYCMEGQALKCPGILTTGRRGAKSVLNCANPPGYFFDASGPAARPCGLNEYSEGLKQQTSCTPCPLGTVTDPGTPVGTQTSSAVCKAGPGYMLVSGSIVVCPVGTFKDAYSDFGTPCMSCLAARGPGLTTANSSSTSLEDCAYVEPGYVAVDTRKTAIMAALSMSPTLISAARPCPQGMYCPGGYLALPVKCPSGLITKSEGAYDIAQCVAPPGWYYDAASGTGMECLNGYYKPSFSNSDSCTSCGDNPATSESITDTTVGWKSSRSSPVLLKDPNNGRNVTWGFVRGNRSSCYLRPGLGAFKVTRGTTLQSRAVLCPAGTYGSTSELRLGVSTSFSCTSCPVNQVTSCTGVVDPSSCLARLLPYTANYSSGTAFTSNVACVHQPGYGWVSTDNSSSPFYSLPCLAGTYSLGGHNSSCAACPSNAISTSEGAATLEGCYTLSPGYAARNASGQPILTAVTDFLQITGTIACPLNYWCEGGSPASTGIPQPCPGGLFTASNGSTSATDCQ